ncbi:hypothetical protein CCACVL1_30422 [Corchorus capsularis]|uniref:Uncharacterized protein n=1 Tax=Corchorus capsularis TaxID=210143 RepID=A0A1R3FXA5_COCAP|nr:hypothetical protein CCACVL1_30422 [Corchorus capsularis]
MAAESSFSSNHKSLNNFKTLRR